MQVFFILYKKKHFSFVTSWSVWFLINTWEAALNNASLSLVQGAEERKAALICAPVTSHQRLFTSWYLFVCVCCACADCLPHKWHVREWLQCSVHAGALSKKKTKNVRLPVVHYEQNRPVQMYGRSIGASLIFAGKATFFFIFINSNK